MTNPQQPQVKHFSQSDERRTFENGWIDIINLGNDNTVGLGNFQPGWKWSEHVKPIVNTDSCQMHHIGYVLSGRMHIAMDNGTEIDLEPGMAVDIPPGHDAWIVGNEPCQLLDFMGMANYALSTPTRARSSQPSRTWTPSRRTRVAKPAGVKSRGRTSGKRKTTSSRKRTSRR